MELCLLLTWGRKSLQMPKSLLKSNLSRKMLQTIDFVWVSTRSDLDSWWKKNLSWFWWVDFCFCLGASSWVRMTIMTIIAMMALMITMMMTLMVTIKMNLWWSAGSRVRGQRWWNGGGGTVPADHKYHHFHHCHVTIISSSSHDHPMTITSATEWCSYNRA